MKKLSIIIPAYNEQTTIELLIEKVLSVKLVNNIDKEIIIINDCSTDNTLRIITGLNEKYTSEIKTYTHIRPAFIRWVFFISINT